MSFLRQPYDSLPSAVLSVEKTLCYWSGIPEALFYLELAGLILGHMLGPNLKNKWSFSGLGEFHWFTYQYFPTFLFTNLYSCACTRILSHLIAPKSKIGCLFEGFLLLILCNNVKYIIYSHFCLFTRNLYSCACTRISSHLIAPKYKIGCSLEGFLLLILCNNVIYIIYSHFCVVTRNLYSCAFTTDFELFACFQMQNWLVAWRFSVTYIV